LGWVSALPLRPPQTAIHGRKRATALGEMMRFDAYPEIGRLIKLFTWWLLHVSPAAFGGKSEIARRRLRRAAMNKN
jgi:hypothetical protein